MCLSAAEQKVETRRKIEVAARGRTREREREGVWKKVVRKEEEEEEEKGGKGGNEIKYGRKVKRGKGRG